ncbi:MAG: VanZ family protein [Bacteroidia bacterium]|nr:VanZ family protein [Bacteroidia bacterium]
MILIFILSHQDKSDTSKTSGLVMWILSFLPINPDFLELDTVKIFIRKAAHFTEYFFLSILFFRVFWWYMERRSAYFWAWAASVLYAMTDEFHQRFIPGRGASILDVGIDGMGALLGILLVWAFHKAKQSLKNRNLQMIGEE